MMGDQVTYRDAGVDIEAGYEVVRRIKKLLGPVQQPGVLGGIGSFGGLFALPKGYEEPVLVAGTDGVGTKLLIAQKADLLETVGIDLVAMCVNDIAAMGAKPLFFLDYLAVGKLVPETAERLLKGIIAGCQEADCALLGGETAEMPGVYDPGEFDLAGFAVGIVEKKQIISGETIGPGDVLIGIASSGLHSNGFSLVRKICFDLNNWDLGTRLAGFDGTLAEVLLTPTRIYVRTIQKLLTKVPIKGIAHITGGGLPENVGRIMPPGCQARIDTTSWPTPPIFTLLQEAGSVSKAEMFHAFNMGLGLVLAVAAADAAQTLAELAELGEAAYRVGIVTTGSGGVVLD